MVAEFVCAMAPHLTEQELGFVREKKEAGKTLMRPEALLCFVAGLT